MTRDPFGDTADPALYVARPACGQALDALEGALAAGQGTLALTGEAGIGKSMLLAVLGERLREGHEVVALPYPALERADLCAWALRALDQDPGVDPDARLLARARRAVRQGRAVVLLVDDAHSLPPDTARGLAGLVREAAGGLRVVAAATDGPGADAALAALAPETRVRLEPMSEAELTRYLSARLDRTGAPVALRARFDGPTVERLHRDSQGNPGRLHELATAVVRRFEEPGGAPADRAAGTPAAPEETDEHASPAGPVAGPDERKPRAASARGRWVVLALAATAIAVLLLVSPVRDAVRGAFSSSRPAQAPPVAPEPDVPAPPVPAVEEVPALPEPAAPGETSEPAEAIPVVPDEVTAPSGPAAAVAPAAEPARPVLAVNAVPWAEVELDGKPVGPTPLALEIEPGPHRLRVRLSDGRLFAREVEVGPEGAALHFE